MEEFSPLARKRSAAGFARGSAPYPGQPTRSRSGAPAIWGSPCWEAGPGARARSYTNPQLAFKAA